MQNTYQDDWTERSLFYNCRMFTDGFQKGHPYGELPPCIHVGILNFNQMISSNYYHKVSLMDEKTKEIYSRKFQFHRLLKSTLLSKQFLIFLILFLWHFDHGFFVDSFDRILSYFLKYCGFDRDRF